VGIVMRVVIDVNVWVSGLLWGGVPAQVLQLVQQGSIANYVSDELLLELQTTLNRPKFQAQLTKRNQTPDRLYSIAQQISTRVEINQMSIPQLRDQNDVKILATAIVAEAQVLITGDLDLLVLNPFESIGIMNPIDFQTAYFR
jgi:putative PIN family toxin of toxin-antitoxin system